MSDWRSSSRSLVAVGMASLCLWLCAAFGEDPVNESTLGVKGKREHLTRPADKQWLAMRFRGQTDRFAGMLVPPRRTGTRDIDWVFGTGVYCRNEAILSREIKRIGKRHITFTGATEDVIGANEVLEDYTAEHLTQVDKAAGSRAFESSHLTCPAPMVLKFNGQRSTTAGIAFPGTISSISSVDTLLSTGVFVRNVAELRLWRIQWAEPTFMNGGFDTEITTYYTAAEQEKSGPAD